MSRDRCSVDTETTSLVEPHLPEGRRLWEVAIIRDTADGPLCAWLQITDVDLTHADEKSLDVGRFDERFHPDVYGPVGPVRHLAGRAKPVMLWGCTEANAARTILELTSGAVLYASKPEFDGGNFADLLRRHGAIGSRPEDVPWYHHPQDITSQALGWLRATQPGQWPEPTYSTSVLSEACGVPVPTDRHSAWADAAWVREWDDVLSGRPKNAGTGILPG